MHFNFFIQLALMLPWITYAAPLDANGLPIHPDPRSTFSLFHGTRVSFAPPVDLSQSVKVGDFHHYSEVPGGFYMTDSLVAAAQFACFQDPNEDVSPDTVAVVEFQWTGTEPNNTGIQFISYNLGTEVGSENTADPFYDQAMDILKSNAIISGPMALPEDKDLTPWFWQYTVINQDTASSAALGYKTEYTVHCSSVPMGSDLTVQNYAAGQGGDPGFDDVLAQLQTKNPDAMSDSGEGSEPEEDSEQVSGGLYLI
ncbi:hypothetical protein B0H19DRAFT_1285122 [Mycena capillaripes]|nr:hypothetical protein B0H19DRAFT_1285122 [Mycena capillaripes]